MLLKKKLKQWKISGTKWVICQLNWPCEKVFFPYISHVILLTDAYTPYSFSHPKVTTFCCFLFFSLFLSLVSVYFIFCFFSFLFLRFLSFAWTSEPGDNNLQSSRTRRPASCNHVNNNNLPSSSSLPRSWAVSFLPLCSPDCLCHRSCYRCPLKPTLEAIGSLYLRLENPQGNSS